MAIRHFNRPIVDSQGNILVGVQCTVKLAGTSTLASLFSDAGGTVAAANPITNDATYGTVDFYVEESTFDLTFSKTGYTFQALNNWTIGNPKLRNILTITSVNGASEIHAFGAIPAGGRVTGVFVTNLLAFGVTGGLTSYQIGDPTTQSKWGTNALTQGAKNTQAGFGSGQQDIYPSATDIVLYAIGGLFDGSGQARVEVAYELDTAT